MKTNFNYFLKQFSQFILMVLFLSVLSVGANGAVLTGHADVGANSITWNNVTVDQTRPYDISFQYKATSSKIVPLSVEIDGNKIQNLDFSTAGKSSYKITKMLTIGEHTVKIKTIGRGSMPNITSLKVEDAKPVQLIIDTDMLTDTDDVAALGIAHALEDNGEAKILGVMVSAHDMEHYNSNTVSAVNYYYNHNNSYPNAKESYKIPVATWYHEQINNGKITTYMLEHLRYANSAYHKVIWDKDFSSDSKLNYQVKPSNYRRYLEILRKADKSDKEPSIVIVVLGQNFEVKRLVMEHNDLFARTVKAVILPSKVGHCDTNTCSNEKAAKENAKKASDELINYLPSNVQLYMADSNFGVKVITGEVYQNTGTPMEVAYSNHGKKFKNSSWDQIAVLLAVRGTGYKNDTPYFNFLKDNGYILSRYALKGYSSFIKNSIYKNHATYAVYENDYSRMEKVLSNLMAQKPKKRHKFKLTDNNVYPVGEAVLKKPNAPSLTFLYNAQLKSVNLRFYDNATNEKGFYVYVNGKKHTSHSPLIKNKNGYVYGTITGLLANKTYSVNIRAFNDAGESNASPMFTFKTLVPLKSAHIITPSKGSNLCGKITFKINRPSNVNVWFGLYDATSKKYLKKWPVSASTSFTYNFTSALNGHKIHAYLNSYDARQKNMYMRSNHNLNYNVKCKQPVPTSKVSELISPTGGAIKGWTGFKWRKNSAYQVRFDIYDVTSKKYILRKYSSGTYIKFNIPKNGHRLRVYLRSYKKGNPKQFGAKTYHYIAR